MIGRIALLLSVIALAPPPVFREPAASSPEFTNDGQMRLPEHYREWVYLTTGFDMSYDPPMQMGDHHTFDNVFVNPAVSYTHLDVYKRQVFRSPFDATRLRLAWG